jgi:hypothetical protein
MKTIIPEVTSADIAESYKIRQDADIYDPCHCCPIAYALERLAEEHLTPNASPAGIQLIRENGWRRTVLELDATQAVRDFMKKWDRKWQAKPHRFRIPVLRDEIGITK